MTNGSAELNPFHAPNVTAVEFDQAVAQPGPEGISGWLALVVIGLFATPVRLLILLGSTHLPLLTNGTFLELINSQSPTYHPLWGLLIVLEVIFNLSIAVMAVAGISLMFRKSRSFPNLMIAFYLSTLFGVIGDFFLASQIPAVIKTQGPEEFQQLVSPLITSIIWVPYMMFSKRVKNTFVN